MTDGVSVDLGALTQFAAETGSLADAHLVSGPGQAGLSSMLAGKMKVLTGAVDPDPGQCVAPHGFSEAQDFTTRHSAMVASAAMFMTDVIQGMASLASGAETCAVRYASTDQLNAAMLATVHAEPAPDAQFARLMLPLDGQATVTADGVRDSFLPSSPAEALFPPAVAAGDQAPGHSAAALDPATRAALDDKFAEQVAQQRANPSPSGSGAPTTTDLGAGDTLVLGKEVLHVRADQARMPDQPVIPPAPAS